MVAWTACTPEEDINDDTDDDDDDDIFGAVR
jgi:hypothetical protein